MVEVELSVMSVLSDDVSDNPSYGICPGSLSSSSFPRRPPGGATSDIELSISSRAVCDNSSTLESLTIDRMSIFFSVPNN